MLKIIHTKNLITKKIPEAGKFNIVHVYSTLRFMCMSQFIST